MHTLVLSILMASALPAAPGNVALHRPYTLEPGPNYQLCTDPDDRTQLTDGDYVKGYFWTQKGTVGWSGRSPVTITIDLGKVEPISGLSYNTAAGVAGVEFPAAIHILLSDDGKGWHNAGDLALLSPAPKTDGKYGLHRFRTEALAAHGRYVKLIVTATQSFVFVDEIEVFRGADDFLQKPLPGPAITDTTAFYRQLLVDSCVRRRLRADAAEVAANLASSNLDQALGEKLWAELKAIETEIPTYHVEAGEDFKTIFPIGDLHRRIFAVRAAIWRGGAGAGGLIHWPARPWDMLSPLQPPESRPPVLDVKMMMWEYRSAAFNILNTSDQPRKIHINIEGLPLGPNPAYVTVHDALFTDTQSGVPVCAALPLAQKDAEGYVIQCVPGLTRQVWLTLAPQSMEGTHAGRIVIKETGLTFRLTLKVYPIFFPGHPKLHLGGWDYTDRERCYSVGPANRTEFLRTLREHFVDSPWAQSAVMNTGRYDAEGKMTAEPDPTEFRTWLDRWPGATNRDRFPGARGFYVFAAVGESFGGHKMGTPPFERAVSAWITWWANQLRKWNIEPSRLHLLLVDEPYSLEMDRVIVAWAKVIRAAQPDVNIWTDPTWQDPSKGDGQMFQLNHVLCPNLPMWLDHRDAFERFYLDQKRQGRRLWFYSCSGPGKLLDPYAYHRMQAWFCWKYGAEGMGYWAFGDSNGASSWNEYASTVGAYTPLFLDDKTVTPGKHMEAIREGVEDFEYLRMLSDRVAEVAKARPDHPALPEARALLAGAAQRVTACMTGSKMTYWKEPKDRGLADQVRAEILEMLMKLKQESAK